MKRKYYEAYEDRYKVIHEKGHSWSSDKPTPIVLETIKKLGLKKSDLILEIGCGEGRDSKAVLDNGYSLLATDISFSVRATPRKTAHYSITDDFGKSKHFSKYAPKTRRNVPCRRRRATESAPRRR